MPGAGRRCGPPAGADSAIRLHPRSRWSSRYRIRRSTPIASRAKTYGSAGIAEHWIINLVDRRVEVFAQPDAASELGHASRKIFRANETIAFHIAGQDLDTLAVIALLP